MPCMCTTHSGALIISTPEILEYQIQMITKKEILTTKEPYLDKIKHKQAESQLIQRVSWQEMNLRCLWERRDVIQSMKYLRVNWTVTNQVFKSTVAITNPKIPMIVTHSEITWI